MLATAALGTPSVCAYRWDDKVSICAHRTHAGMDFTSDSDMDVCDVCALGAHAHDGGVCGVDQHENLDTVAHLDHPSTRGINAVAITGNHQVPHPTTPQRTALTRTEGGVAPPCAVHLGRYALIGWHGVRTGAGMWRDERRRAPVASGSVEASALHLHTGSRSTPTTCVSWVLRMCARIERSCGMSCV